MSGTTRDIPHTQVGDMQREHLAVDLSGCNVFLVVQAMNEFDAKKSFKLRFDSWPQEIQTIFEREIAAWEAKFPDRRIRACTLSIADQAFMLALHWRPKAGGAA